MEDAGYTFTEEDLVGKELMNSISDQPKNQITSMSLKEFCEQTFENAMGYAMERSSLRWRSDKREFSEMKLDLNRETSLNYNESSHEHLRLGIVSRNDKARVTDTLQEKFEIQQDSAEEESCKEQKKKTEAIDFFLLEPDLVAVLKKKDSCKQKQKQLVQLDLKGTKLVYCLLREHLALLLKDKYANYFCSRLYAMLDKDTKANFLEMIETDFAQIAEETYGTFALQSLVESTVELENQVILIKSANKNLHKMMLGEFSVHVVVKVQQFCAFEELTKINNTLLNNFTRLSKHKHGFRLSVELVKSCDSEMRKLIETLITDKFDLLVNNEFGNQAIQACIRYWPVKDKWSILKKFFNRFEEFSLLKYSSNLVESIIELEERSVLSNFLKEIKSRNSIIKLITHPFGNYVIQKFLKLKMTTEVKELCNMIEQVLPLIREEKLKRKWLQMVHVAVKKNYGYKQESFLDEETDFYGLN